jgi:hypothetical protein
MLSLRLLVVLLVAVLLPVRGAAGAAMLCSGEPGPRQGHAAAHAGDVPAQAHPAHDGAASPHAHAQGAVSGTATAGPEHREAASNDLGQAHCPVCASACGATPLGVSAPEIVPPVVCAEVEYRDTTARAPVFHAEAQERPPRSA